MPLQRASLEAHEGGYYVRLALFDRPRRRGRHRHAHG